MENHPIAIPATLFSQAVSEAETLIQSLTGQAQDLLCENGRANRTKMTTQQHIAHGLAWYVTSLEVLRQTADWAARVEAAGQWGEVEQVFSAILFAEYISQMAGGIPMTQTEFTRISDFSSEDIQWKGPACDTLLAVGTGADIYAKASVLLPQALERATLEQDGLDETLQMVRESFRRFASEKVMPFAHDWHLKNDYIPIEIVEEMSELGVFGLTIPESYGGLGMGKTAMCVVSEELSRGYIGVGSLGTRSEIAAELILQGGREEQKSYWLPKIASGEILPTAVFTEPDTGSDLGSLRTRATLEGDVFQVHGAKTWITHAARADMMTLLVRTEPDTQDFRGLSMLLAEKPRGDDAEPFPIKGMSGGEIEVLGYRGMKEFEIGFDGFEVKRENLLGAETGQGFKQLMATFESARIQTAARAIGVAQNALELGLNYALQRKQFGGTIYEFPRVSNKLVRLAAEIMGVRQLTYHAARQKDSGKRCDMEAGMAKLMAARIAWSGADNALQIHGGNGFALEYPISRVLQDARILNIFEGAGEVQAMVIARRLLEQGRN